MSKHDALADEAQRLGALGLGAVPLHHDHARGALAALPHRQQRAHLQGSRAAPRRASRPRAPARARLAHALGELDRAQHVGRLVDEIAGEEHAVGHRLAGAQMPWRRRPAWRRWTTSLRRPLRRLVLLAASSVLRGLIFLEGVAPQQRAQRQVGGKCLGARPRQGRQAPRRGVPASPLRALIWAKAKPPSSRRSSSLAALPVPTRIMRWASMPAGARISMDVLALPVNSAARAAFVSAPLVRSSMPRAAGPSASSCPASSRTAPAGAADSGTN